MNLVVNARDATPRGGKLTLETSNVDLDEAAVRTLSEVSPGPYVRIVLTDTGVGMNGAVKSRIFVPFFTTKHIVKSTGLGLATVYAIVRQSGGHIEVESQINVGTTFTVYLPATGSIAGQALPEGLTNVEGGSGDHSARRGSGGSAADRAICAANPRLHRPRSLPRPGRSQTD